MSEWLEDLTDLNLLAVRDVAIDVHDAAQMSARPSIPILPTVMRFRELMPFDGIEARDRYGMMRGQALKLLETHGIVRSVNAVHDPYEHRWQGNMACEVVNAAALKSIVADLEKEHQRRIDKRSPAESRALTRTYEPLTILRNLLAQFHAVALDLRKRRTGRAPLEIADEYDVQYLLGALLKLHFGDVRREEWTPSYAGGASRTDFLLKHEQVVLETKMTRAGLTDRAVGDELILDIAHYSKHQDCMTLVCFVYDPDHRLTNPGGLEGDLSEKRNGLTVQGLIVPSR